MLDKTPAYIATSIETRGEDELLVEYRMEELTGEADYVRQTETQTETETKTMTPEETDIMTMVQKTVEIYKMKRRH